jgi:hypothetical protein
VPAVSIACSDGETPPSGPDTSGNEPTASFRQGPEQAKLQVLARRLAAALADDAFRQDIKKQRDASPVVEHKFHFRSFLDGRGQAALRRVLDPVQPRFAVRRDS